VAAVEEAWLYLDDSDEFDSTDALYEFFGLSSDDPGELDEHIRTKRLLWRHRQARARTQGASQYAAAVLDAIAWAEDRLKRGAHEDARERATVLPMMRDPSSLDEALANLETLLATGQYATALTQLRSYNDRWGSEPQFVDMRANVILESAAQAGVGALVDTNLLKSAIAGERQAIRELGPSEAKYLTLIELLGLAGYGEEMVDVLDEVLRNVPEPSPWFHARLIALVQPSSLTPALLHACVDLADGAHPEDRAMRSLLVQVIIDASRRLYLPIDSLERLDGYRAAVATASWIAQGVPEAEDFVRMHRMWAANASQLIFAGNWQVRAFIGLITLLAGLPLLNRLMSKPAWQILLDGPIVLEGRYSGSSRARNRAWLIVTRNHYVFRVHQGIRLPWQAEPDQWIDIDPEPLFTF
jgi:hypothetical protein